jgi:hypothetical protein
MLKEAQIWYVLFTFHTIIQGIKFSFVTSKELTGINYVSVEINIDSNGMTAEIGSQLFRLSATDPFTFAIVLKYTVNETMKI